jgi:hypothetical protein
MVDEMRMLRGLCDVKGQTRQTQNPPSCCIHRAVSVALLPNVECALKISWQNNTGNKKSTCSMYRENIRNLTNP